MGMTLVKKTAEYSIFKRGDDRYAVKDANKNAVNGEEKTRILVEEELVKVAVAPAPVVEEAPVEEAAAEEAPAEEAPAEEAPEVEAAAEETPEVEAAAEEAPAEEAAEEDK